MAESRNPKLENRVKQHQRIRPNSVSENYSNLILDIIEKFPFKSWKKFSYTSYTYKKILTLVVKKTSRDTAYLRISRWIRVNSDLPVVRSMRKEASSGRGGNGGSGVDISSIGFGEINSEDGKRTKDEDEENNKKLNPD